MFFNAFFLICELNMQNQGRCCCRCVVDLKLPIISTNPITYEAAESTPVLPRRMSFKYHSDAANTSLLEREILPFTVERQLVQMRGTLSGERSRINSKEK